MKKLLLAIALMCTLTAPAADKSDKSALLASDKLIWAGIDYSQALFMGPGEFDKPETIFPKMLDTWNNLFLQERIRFVEKATGKKVVIDIAGVTKANQSASAKQIINIPDPDDTVEKTRITPEMIAKAVKFYKMDSRSGLGVVFIVDRLIKVNNKGRGAVYVVAFDVATREVIFSQREVHNATGFGFRNYWFRVIKDSEKALKDLS